jgi:hypothetical protein
MLHGDRVLRSPRPSGICVRLAFRLAIGATIGPVREPVPYIEVVACGSGTQDAHRLGPACIIKAQLMAKLRPNCPVALHPTSLKNQPSILDAQNPGLDSCVWWYVGLMLSIVFALGRCGELIDSC